MSPSLTLFFIVEPEKYQFFACFLAASARRFLDPGVRLVGYCPEHRMGELDPAAVTALARMDCAVRPMRTRGLFDPAYPHGNKIAACLEPRDTDWSGFLDSDIVFVAPQEIGRLLRPGHVSVALATSIGWAPAGLWEAVYGAVGLPVPDDRVRLSRNRRQEVPPYFNSGMVFFPETHRDAAGRSFAQTWMDTARIVDRVPLIEPFRRPYLDQITLPVAMRRAGLGWNPLSEQDHFILGGRLRYGAADKAAAGITAVHYRHWGLLREAGLESSAQDSLAAQLGVRQVRDLGGGGPGQAAPQRLDFDPATPAPAPLTRQNVRLVPWGRQEPGEARRAAGLFDADGQPIPEGHCWHDDTTPVTLIPDAGPDAPAERLEGRWLYGGMFHQGFGRLLSETTARLWAVDAAGPLTGIVFLPESAVRNERRLYRHQLPVLAALGLGHLQVRVPQGPVTIAELVIPAQGSGAGQLAAGLPDHRAWMRGRIAALAAGDLRRDRPADIFISRSAYPDRITPTFAQAEIDRLMAAAGYAILRPEQMDLAEQVRSYRAARRIVALDGAALILAAMAVGPDTQVCVIRRGPSGRTDDHLRRFRHYAGITAVDVDAVRGFLHPVGRAVQPEATSAVLDLARIGARLAEEGFIASSRGWAADLSDTIAADVVTEERRLKTRLAWHGS